MPKQANSHYPYPPLLPLSFVAATITYLRNADINPALLTTSPLPKPHTPPAQQAPGSKPINPMNHISYTSSSSQPLHLAAPSLQPTQHPPFFPTTLTTPQPL